MRRRTHAGARPGDTLDLLGPVAAGPASRYLFTDRTGQPIRPDNLTDRFNQLAEAAKIRRSARTRSGA